MLFASLVIKQNAPLQGIVNNFVSDLCVSVGGCGFTNPAATSTTL